MRQETVELEAVKVHVEIRMNPIHFNDEYVKFPSNSDILEHLANCIREGVLDEYFEIIVSAVEE